MGTLSCWAAPPRINGLANSSAFSLQLGCVSPPKSRTPGPRIGRRHDLRVTRVFKEASTARTCHPGLAKTSTFRAEGGEVKEGGAKGGTKGVARRLVEDGRFSDAQSGLAPPVFGLAFVSVVLAPQVLALSVADNDAAAASVPLPGYKVPTELVQAALQLDPAFSSQGGWVLADAEGATEDDTMAQLEASEFPAEVFTQADVEAEEQARAAAEPELEAEEVALAAADAAEEAETVGEEYGELEGEVEAETAVSAEEEAQEADKADSGAGAQEEVAGGDNKTSPSVEVFKSEPSKSPPSPAPETSAPVAAGSPPPSSSSSSSSSSSPAPLQGEGEGDGQEQLTRMLMQQKQQYDSRRLLDQNRRIQELNGAPTGFPAFVREGFDVKVLTGPEFVTSPSGLIYWDVKEGKGDLPTSGQQVTFHYVGFNESGRRIDSTYLQGRPAQTRVGINAMIPGFEEAISTMRPGGVRRVIIPPELGPPTGPSTFFSAKQYEVFDIELLQVKDCQRRQILFYSDVVCE